MNYTQEQLQAIEAGSGNLLLSAAAGSGKTFTLVERILSLISRGQSVDEMLIVTFTRAAAAEMRQRLIEKLAERELHEQLKKAEYAQVQTIDSFCSDVLKNHFEAAGVDPSFRIPDEAELRQLELRALQSALEGCYEQRTEALEALHFGRGVKQVGELVQQLYRFSQNRPDPEAWLRDNLGAPGEDAIRRWFVELARAIRRELGDARALGQGALALIERTPALQPYEAALRSDLEPIERSLGADYEQLAAIWAGFSHEKLKGIRMKDATEQEICAQERVKQLRDALKKRVKRACERLAPVGDAILDVRQNQPALDALLTLTLRFIEELSALKAEKSVLSFSDVAHRALRALREPGVAQAVKARFTSIFVDEYQDVSELQQALIDCVARPDNVFMVGDVKQSIYRFRLADPTLFLLAQRDYRAGNGGRLISLTSNYRSRANILHFTNEVFRRAMRGEGSEIEYDRDAYLRPGRAFEGQDPPVEIALLTDLDVDIEEEQERQEYRQAEREGFYIARRIRQLLSEGHRPSDIAVLLRSRTAMSAIESALDEAGIAVYADVNKGYLEALEVRLVLSLLQLIENRRRDRELVGVLRSPIVGLTSSELAEIRLGRQEGTYRDAVLAYLDRGDALSDKLRAFEAQLDRWRALSRALPLSELIDTVLRESAYYAHAGNLPRGAQRQANLDLLLTYASEFDATQQGALTGFLRYVKRIEQSDGTMGAAHALGEGEDVVRLITVHKSKGLEYPVVIAAQLGQRLLRAALSGQLMAHKELGVGLALTDMALGSRRKTLPQRAIEERQRFEELNEELRILYVLLTRAKERLILVGSVRSIGDSAERWSLDGGQPLTPECNLDVILPPVMLAAGADLLLAEGSARLSVGEADVLVNLVPNASVSPLSADAPPLAEAAEVDEAALARAEQALRWRYPYADAVRLPLKLTASGLTRELTGPDAMPSIVRRPRFLQQDALTATERGTLTHQALRILDLGALRGLGAAQMLPAVRAQLGEMLLRGQLEASLDPALIRDFLLSRPGQRLLASGQVRREWPFNVRMPIAEVLDTGGEGSILVQGVIDCCFLEDGQWVLMDYKTDRSEDIEQLRAHYAPQLRLYSSALYRITGIPVRQALLCLLRHGIAIEID